MCIAEVLSHTARKTIILTIDRSNNLSNIQKVADFKVVDEFIYYQVGTIKSNEH